MCRWLMVCLLMGLFLPASAQVEVVDGVIEEVLVDSVYHKSEEERYKYLEEGYYDSIAVAKPYAGEEEQHFEDMLPRYQTDEFAYSESITTKLSFLDRLRQRFWRFIDDIFPKQSLFSEDDFYNLLAILGLVFVLYLCYHFFVGKNKIYTHIKKEQDGEEAVSFVERNLMDVDVRKYIADAERQREYALAIRYHQLLNIQVLNKRGLIEWDYTKTNAELMEEVGDTEVEQGFLACASLFDKVWFGDFKIEEVDYRGIALQFEQFQKRWS